MEQFLAAADAHGATATAHEEDQAVNPNLTPAAIPASENQDVKKRSYKELNLPSGHFQKLHECYNGLDAGFREIVDREMQNAGNGYHCLLRLLKVAPVSMVTEVMSPFVDQYRDGVFKFENFSLTITLEDILYLTGLPIKGKPVISRKSEPDSFFRVFKIPGKSIKKLDDVVSIAQNKDNKQNRSTDERMKALVLLIIYSLVAATNDRPLSAYAQYVENLNEVNSYAWGAALLTFLQYGLQHGRRGSHWITFAFILYRFPCLRSMLPSKVVEGDFQIFGVPIIVPLSHNISKYTNNHRKPEPINVEEVRSRLTLENVVWQPYENCVLPTGLEDHARFVTYWGPTFCHEYKVNHLAYLVPRQFGVESFSNIPSLIFSEKNGKSIKSEDLKAWEKQIVLAKDGEEEVQRCTSTTEQLKIIEHLEQLSLGNVQCEAPEEPSGGLAGDLAPDSSDPSLPDKLNVLTLDDAIPESAAVPEEEKTVVELDEEPVVPSQEDHGEMDRIINYPMRNDLIEIKYSSLNCLEPQKYISSDIMNFYVECLKEKCAPSEITGEGGLDCHIFNTFFYTKLKGVLAKKDEESFAKFRRWWKNVNIFQKAYLFVPICEEDHWSLVIVCMPDKEDQSELKLLHLDSLETHSKNPIFISNIKSFLKEEWKHVKDAYDVPFAKSVWELLPERIGEQKIEVPQQGNNHDCGLFVLYFMERFILNAPERLKNEINFGRDWFHPKEASDLRSLIRVDLEKQFNSGSSIMCLQEKCPPNQNQLRHSHLGRTQFSQMEASVNEACSSYTRGHDGVQVKRSERVSKPPERLEDNMSGKKPQKKKATKKK